MKRRHTGLFRSRELLADPGRRSESPRLHGIESQGCGTGRKKKRVIRTVVNAPVLLSEALEPDRESQQEDEGLRHLGWTGQSSEVEAGKLELPPENSDENENSPWAQ